VRQIPLSERKQDGQVSGMVYFVCFVLATGNPGLVPLPGGLVAAPPIPNHRNRRYRSFGTGLGNHHFTGPAHPTLGLIRAVGSSKSMP
jgi:hypothetical protein